MLHVVIPVEIASLVESLDTGLYIATNRVPQADHKSIQFVPHQPQLFILHQPQWVEVEHRVLEVAPGVPRVELGVVPEVVLRLVVADRFAMRCQVDPRRRPLTLSLHVLFQFSTVLLLYYLTLGLLIHMCRLALIWVLIMCVSLFLCLLLCRPR